MSFHVLLCVTGLNAYCGGGRGPGRQINPISTNTAVDRYRLLRQQVSSRPQLDPDGRHVANGGRTGRTTSPQIRSGPLLRSTFLHLILAANLVDNLRTSTLKLLSRNPTFYLKNEQFGNLIFRKIITLVATICRILRLKCTKKCKM